MCVTREDMYSDALIIFHHLTVTTGYHFTHLMSAYCRWEFDRGREIGMHATLQCDAEQLLRQAVRAEWGSVVTGKHYVIL